MPTTSKVAKAEPRRRISGGSEARRTRTTGTEVRAIRAQGSVVRKTCFDVLGRSTGAWECRAREVGLLKGDGSMDTSLFSEI
jgi:hypothetical protein